MIPRNRLEVILKAISTGTVINDARNRFELIMSAIADKISHSGGTTYSTTKISGDSYTGALSESWENFDSLRIMIRKAIVSGRYGTITVEVPKELLSQLKGTDGSATLYYAGSVFLYARFPSDTTQINVVETSGDFSIVEVYGVKY